MTGSGVMTIFVYKELIRNPEIGIPLSNFCSISVNCGQLGIPNLAQMSLIKSYRTILQNARVTAFTISDLLRENQQGGEITVPPPKLGLRDQQEYTIRTISQSTEVLSLYCFFKKVMLSQCLVPYITMKVNSYSMVLRQQPLAALQIQNFH